MNINKLILIIFTIILYVNQQIVITYCQETTCTTFVDSSSLLTSECGTQVDKPCSSIYQSIQSCSVFNNIIINIVPGNYTIDNQGTFKQNITNTTISILNSSGSNQGITPVIIDLLNAPGPFINIEALTSTDSSVISISGITFKNGNQSIGGSILNVTSSWINVSINNCNFINNVKSLSFINSPNLSSGLTLNKTVSIIQSSFSNVKLVGSSIGGIIYNSMDTILFTIDQCTFSNITNSKLGSIAYFNYGMMVMTNSVISQSISQGAIYMSSYTVTINNNPLFIFENVNFTMGQAGLGFVIASQYSITLFKNCNFNNNNNTGIIYGLNGGKITVISSTFQNNYNAYSSLDSGGAITSYSTPLSISNCQFIKNHALSGGAININGSSLNIYGSAITIENSIFTNNSAMLGGAIAITDNTITLTNSQFNGNYISSLNGGSTIYCFEHSEIEWSNSTFKNIGLFGTKYNSYGLNCLRSSCEFMDANSKNTKYICNNDDNNNSDDDDGLSTGKKVAIAFAVIGGFILIIIIIIAILRNKKRNQYKSISL